MGKYDIIFILGETFFDHPICGIAILKRLLEKKGYKVAVIEMPQNAKEITRYGKPNLFFGVSSGCVDSMLRNYSSLNRPREGDELLSYEKKIPDRAVIVYSNWIKENFKDAKIVLGGTEAVLRRFSHYDYWSNSLRKSILFDTRADILVYGSGEKQTLEIAKRLKEKKDLNGIEGTCVKLREINDIKDLIMLPTHEEISSSNEKFCDMQNLLTNWKNLCQKTGNFYVVQYKSPKYTSKDLDEYYELPFTRDVRKVDYMRGFEFSIVTHRGCIGNCNFCSLRLTSGDRIISRSEDSIIREIEYITKLPHFRGNIDDFGGPSANMYGMDCSSCGENCINCSKLDRSMKRLLNLLRRARQVKSVKKVFIRSGIRYDLVNKEYLSEITKHHISGKMKIAPEHVNKDVLNLMNKNTGNLNRFLQDMKDLNCEVSFYFMVGHPGTSMRESKELADFIRKLRNAESVQIFTPTPMTVSTCMYYTGLNPKTKKKIYIPYTFKEKKEQKRILNLQRTN